MKTFLRRLWNEPAFLTVVLSNGITAVLTLGVTLPGWLNTVLLVGNVALSGGALRARVTPWSPKDAEDAPVTPPGDLTGNAVDPAADDEPTEI